MLLFKVGTIYLMVAILSTSFSSTFLTNEKRVSSNRIQIEGNAQKTSCKNQDEISNQIARDWQDETAIDRIALNESCEFFGKCKDQIV